MIRVLYVAQGKFSGTTLSLAGRKRYLLESISWTLACLASKQLLVKIHGHWGDMKFNNVSCKVRSRTYRPGTCYKRVDCLHTKYG